jgi:acyl carrier protein
MDLPDFITNFAAQFEETEIALFTPQTQFRDLDGWSSLVALSVMAMADEEYDVKLKGDDMRNSNTIQDLYDIIDKETDEWPQNSLMLV